MSVVTVRGARAHLSQLLRRAVAGEKIVVARGGLPVARLVALARRGPRRPGSAWGHLTEAFFEPLLADEFAAWQQ
jgi:prevent-host-death family protein